MGLTQLQARDIYIVDSMAQFLYRRVVTQYQTEADASATKTPDFSAGQLKVIEGSPDDPSVLRAAPVIAIGTINSSGKDRFLELGTSRGWRTMNFVFYCYPALDATNSPSSVASKLLSTLMRDAFGGETIKIVDYSNVLCTPDNILYCQYNLDLTTVAPPVFRGKTSTIAAEKHRFDMHVGVKYPVVESLAT